MAHTLQGKTISGSVELAIKNGGPVWRQSQSYRVEADSDDPPYSGILLTSGLPIPMTTFTDDGLMICQSLGADRIPKHRRLWEVTAEFSSDVEQSQNTQFPEEWVPVYELKKERVQEPSFTDASGNAIINSAGQTFPQGIILTRYLPVWEFFQFEPASLSDEQMLTRDEVVNSTVFKGRAAKTLLCTITSSVIGFYYGRLRRLTQYRIIYNVRDWTDKRLDTGTVYLDGGVQKPYTVGTAPNEVVIEGSLNGSGAKQTAGVAPAIRVFDKFPTIDFNTFLR